MLDVNDSVVSLSATQHSLLTLSGSLIVLRGTGGGNTAHTTSGHGLLHEQVVDLGDVFVEEVRVSDKLLELKDSVQEATSNLTGHLSVDILDGEVNSVTNEFNFLGTVLDGIKFGKVNLGEADLGDGSLLLGLVLGGPLLLATHSGEGRVVVDNGLLGSLALASALTSLTVVSLSASASSLASSVVLALVLATTASTSLVVSSLVSVLSLSTLVHVTSMVLLHVDALRHVLLFGSLVLTVSEPIEHLSLFLSVLLVLELLLGDPEVNADGLVAEGSVLVKALNGLLSVVNILVEDESLLVGGSSNVGVHAELNGDNGGDALVQGRTVHIEVSDLTSFGEANPKVGRVSSGNRVDGVSSLESNSRGGTMLTGLIAFSNGNSTSLALATNSNLLDSGVVF